MNEKFDPLKFNDSIHDSLPFEEHVDIVREGMLDIIEDIGIESNIDQTTVPTLSALLESFLRKPSSETALAMAECLENLSKDGNFLGTTDSIVHRAIQIQESSFRSLAVKLPAGKTRER